MKKEKIMDLLDTVKFNNQGLVTAIAQDAETNEVLMIAYMNRETLAETFRTRTMVYFSRSRRKRWLKGETSGHIQTVKSVYIDCDGDALLFKINQKGNACHEGYFSCFFREKVKGDWAIVKKKIEE